MRCAVIGAGPAGFYACDKLLAAGFEVDLLDALPTPFGLVRSGVAPDHPNIKAVTRVYEKTAAKPGFRFFGGVVLGEHVSRAELLERYHAVVYAFGTDLDRRLGIPGEDLPGSYPATATRTPATRGSTSAPSGRWSSATATWRSTWPGCCCSTPASSR
jgi:ferredoxin--NADP+ reductase